MKKELDKFNQRSPRANLKIALQVLRGLVFIHDKDIIHRDLKPQNIFKVGGEWKIGDFGQAKQSQFELKCKNKKERLKKKNFNNLFSCTFNFKWYLIFNKQ